jgi:hypothetical protein
MVLEIASNKQKNKKESFLDCKFHRHSGGKSSKRKSKQKVSRMDDDQNEDEQV